MSVVWAKITSATLRALADAMDAGKAQIDEITVYNDTDIVEVPSPDGIRPAYDTMFRCQIIKLRIRSFDPVVKP